MGTPVGERYSSNVTARRPARLTPRRDFSRKKELTLAPTPAEPPLGSYTGGAGPAVCADFVDVKATRASRVSQPLNFPAGEDR